MPNAKVTDQRGVLIGTTLLYHASPFTSDPGRWGAQDTILKAGLWSSGCTGSRGWETLGGWQACLCATGTHMP